MIDKLIKLYRKMNEGTRQVLVLIIAGAVVFSTMHFMTFPAAAMSRNALEGNPEGILIGDEAADEDFDNASAGEDTTEEDSVDNEEPAVTDGAETTETAEPAPDTEPDADSETQPDADPETEETPETVIDETPAADPAAGEETPAEPEDEPEEVSDPEADAETAADWEEMFRDIELTGVWADDLLTLAEEQIGYEESDKNFVRDDEGVKHGYTRYGAWYGEPYAKWDSLFVMFNLYYTGITKLDFPFKADCEEWADELKEAEMFFGANEYLPSKGDLVFADIDEDGKADHVAIVKDVEYSEGNPDKLIVLEGDIDNAVKESKYEFYNPLIVGFAKLPENPEGKAEPKILTFTGTANRVDVTVEYEEDAFPEGTTMNLQPIWQKPVIDAINDTVASEDTVEVVRVQAVDITFLDAEGNEIEPAKPIKVMMKSRAVPDAATDKPVVVHVDDELSTSVVKTSVPAEEPIGSKEAVTFEAGSFSIYAIVYTVDFSYEVNGKVYGFTMQGADTVSLRALIEALHVYEKETEETEVTNEELSEPAEVSEDSPLDKFMAEIENVTFSDTSLLVPAFVEEDATAGQIKTDLKLFPSYPLGLKQSEVLELNAKEYKEGDWILISMKPFDTTETLTVSMKNGNKFYITVTDAQDAPMDGDKVQTISNPAGTTIDLFDYWIVSQDLYGRDGWGDLNQGWGSHGDEQGLNGSGNNKGINSSPDDPEHGHALKFSPAWAGTVYNGNKIGTTGNAWQSLNKDMLNGLNSYTGDEYTWHWNCPNPFPGIVQNNLYNGYPILTNNQEIGSTGESLRYLFDPGVEHAGKESFQGVNQLLYVDPDGYYTYDSRYYAAAFDESSKTFTVTEQTSEDSGVRGFWPFGTQKYWAGMHVKTQFSMPAGGEVLNPAGALKPMQFEFSGDDDVWIYVDGILIGDAGGIHNRTEVDINFKTGIVSISGSENKYLDDLFRTGLRDQGKTEDEIAQYMEANFNGHTFKDGSYHTFDFFYLERGGDESNLYIHYNLVSTADFTAHKTYQGRDSLDILQRNQFKFELIGLDGKYRSVKNPETGAYELVKVDDTSDAIMPHAAAGGEGTVESPYYNSQTSTTLSDGTTVGSQTYITGDTEDGNVNFGSAVISEIDMHDCDEGKPPVYRYIVREVVPEDAVNADGVAWKDATDAQKAAGGFVYNSIVYDGTVHYMTARVTKWEEPGPDGTPYVRHGLSKTYYTDDTFTTVKPDTQFINFENRYQPGIGDLQFTKVKTDGEVLPGAVFGLFRDSACKKPAKDAHEQDITATSDANGIVKFEDIPAGMYYLKEVAAPQGYELNPAVYKAYVINKTGDSYITDWGNEPVNTITNMRPNELTVIKKWQNSQGEEVAGSLPVSIILKRYHEEEQETEAEEHTVSLQLHIDDPDWGDDYKNIVVETSETSKGDRAVIEWYDCWQQYNSLRVLDGLGNEIDSDMYTLTPIDENDHSRRLTVTPITSDIQVLVNYPGNLAWLWQNNAPDYHKSKFINPSILIPVPTERKVDPEFSQPFTLTAPDYRQVWSIGGSDADYQASGFDLPKWDANGNEYGYFVEEDPLDGYEVTYENNDGVLKGTITVTNKDTHTVTADIKIVKVIRGTETPLSGAKFTLTQVDENGNAVAGGIHYENVPVSENGTVEFKELVPGRYMLEETEVPQDYIKEEGFYYLVITEEGNAEIENGHSYKLIHKWQDNEFLVENDYGAALPKTGGSGTGMLNTLGGILILSAGYFLLKRNR